MRIVRILQVFFVLVIVHLLLCISQGILFGLIIGPIQQFNALDYWIQLSTAMILGFVIYSIAGSQIAVRLKYPLN